LPRIQPEIAGRLSGNQDGTTPSCEGGAILFFAQTFDSPARDILNAANAFEHCFAEGFGRDDAFDKTAREFKAFVGRQIKNSFCEVGRYHDGSVHDTADWASRLVTSSPVQLDWKPSERR
jgi:hypothetical protein